MSQQVTVNSALRVGRVPLSVRTQSARSRKGPARVVVEWCRTDDGVTPSSGPTHVELQAELDAPSSTTWTSRTSSGSKWAEALSSARATEVVLTALDADLSAKHLVLELAGLLTLKLAETQPLIRVRFLAPVEPAVAAKRRATPYQAGAKPVGAKRRATPYQAGVKPSSKR